MSIPALFFTFMYIGLCAIGGGMATIPLIQQQLVEPGILSPEKLLNMIAIAESTPGPIGINIATYVGFDTAGIPGAVCATLGLIFPSIIIIILIARFFTGFQEKPIVRSAFYGLRAAVVGLIASAALQVLQVTIVRISNGNVHLASTPTLILFVLIFITYTVFKKHPIIYILAGAIFGIFFL